MLPENFPKWQLVYYYFRKWKREGVFEEILEYAPNRIRESVGKAVLPSVGAIDSQSVKTGSYGGEAIDIDGGKKVKGRKHHILTDTLRLLLSVVVHAANEYDGKKAFDVIKALKHRFERMKKIFADGGYRDDELREKVAQELGYDLEMTCVVIKQPNLSPCQSVW